MHPKGLVNPIKKNLTDNTIFRDYLLTDRFKGLTFHNHGFELEKKKLACRTFISQYKYLASQKQMFYKYETNLDIEFKTIASYYSKGGFMIMLF